MECVVCYNGIKKSYITCHSLCKKCYNKIMNKKCPVCRQQLIVLLNSYDCNKQIEVEYFVKGEYQKKYIHTSKLKKYVFSAGFKNMLERRLNRKYIQFKDEYAIINWNKYDYFDTVDKKNICFLYQNCYSECQIILWLDKIFQKLPLTLKDIFLINNYVYRKLDAPEYVWNNPTRRVISHIWAKTKLEYVGS